MDTLEALVLLLYIKVIVGMNWTLPSTNMSITSVNISNISTYNQTNATNPTENRNESAFDLIAKANENEGDHMPVHEVDMRFPIPQTDQSGLNSSVLNAPIRDRSALWPNGVIPYVLEYSIRRQPWFVKMMRGAMTEWETKTCIKFRPKTIYDINYVEIQISDGCNSDVGMIGGRQTVSLGNGCTHHSVILHELGHVIGFWHEQNRPDRDKYIKIVRENIIAKYDFAFHKYSTHKINSLGVPYDYKSIMHYGKTAFSKNRRPTIVARNGQVMNFGNDHLSPLDILQANRLYKCPDKSQLYPSFPEDFSFSRSRLSRHYCIRLTEPYDYWWGNNYLCVKSGKKRVSLYWSNNGDIPGKLCTQITYPRKSYYKGWRDNFLCVPNGSPYRFLWSVGVKPRNFKCMEWKKNNADAEWGRPKYLCSKDINKPVDGNWSPWALWSQCTKNCGTGYQKRKRDCTNPPPQNGGHSCAGDSYETRDCNKQKCQDLPRWPEDFTYRFHRYTPYSSTCIRTYERMSYFQWTNYYFCSRDERRDINMKWSDYGPIKNMKCVLINEPKEPSGSGWKDNYLCVPKDSPYNFKWSHSGPIRGLRCVQWVAKKGHQGWDNNYLCAPPFRAKVTVVKVHGKWSAWSVWTKCSKTCGTGYMLSFRRCNNPAPSNGGRACHGSREQRRSCKIQDCPKVCRKELNQNSGRFHSPKIGPGKTSCTWILTVAVGYKIELTFDKFNLGGRRVDCRTDYVEIHDGRQATSAILRKFCTSLRPQSVRSSGNTMFITLRTSNNIRTPEFSARWESHAIPTTQPQKTGVCGGVLTGEDGQLSSPNYPRNYPRKTDCVWIIRVPLHKVLKLRFLAFKLENKHQKRNECRYDYVVVRDGSSSRSPQLGVFCGSTTPGVISAFTNSLWIKFHSDGSNSRTGFKALYYTESRTVTCNKKWRHFVSDDGTEYCYLIRRRKVVWMQARNDCKRKNSDLLSIATSKEQWFVRNELMAETKYYELWMGYNDRRREGRWTWSDQTKVDYNNWAGGDPNNGGYWKKEEDCGVLKPNGKWNDFPCNYRFMYICKKKLS